MTLLTALVCMGLRAQTYSSQVWQIGKQDGSLAEFALSGKHYSELPKAFPGSVYSYIVGDGDVSKDVPYVIPGPADSWAGSPNGTLMVRFGAKSFDKDAAQRLVIDFMEVHEGNPPRLEVSLNGYRTEVATPRGANINYMDNFKTTAHDLKVSVDIPAGHLRQGDNTLMIRIKSGSWMVLDDIRLESTHPVEIGRTSTGISFLGAYSQPGLIYGRTKDELLHPMKMNVMNWGRKEARVSWSYDGKEGGTLRLKPGMNTVEIGIPEGVAGHKVKLALNSGNREQVSANVDILPAEKWTVYLVQHTHTDIGYTKPQTEILTEHLRYIDYAIEYCEATEQYPDDAKFRWTCEASWAVREWLRIRPREQVEKFLHYVKAGQIEVTAMFFNMSELSGENNYKTFLEPIEEFHRMGIDVQTAMQNDVNGVAWCLADYLPSIGVKYLTMGSNSHRANIPFDKPTLYRWESPSGSSVISYRSDHYNTGNFWGIDKCDMPAFENGLFSYISSLKRRNYDFPLVSVQYSGYFTDNSPPSRRECELIRQWNERYAWPKLRSATIHEFMAEIDAHYADKLPVYRAAYPDYWTDGFGSAARETAASRKTQSDMLAIEGMLSMAEKMGTNNVPDIDKEIRRIHENLLFYDEHTFGAAESLGNPLCENSQVQWAEKGSYAWEALKSAQMLYETAIGYIQGKLYRSEHPTVTFFNTLGWNRSSLLKLYIDFEVVPRDRAFRLVDENGHALKVQPLNSRSEGRYYSVWAENIPAMGYRTYEIVLDEGKAEAPKAFDFKDGVVENNFYRVTFDLEKGGIKSVVDKELSRELVDAGSEWNVGAYVYESLLDDRGQMEQKRFDKYERSGLREVRYTGTSRGDIYSSVYFEGMGDGCDDKGIKVEVRIYNDIKRIEMCYSARRLPETNPSGIYVAFPFAMEQGRLAFDVPGGLVYSGENQIPNSTASWNTVQNFVSARNNDAQILISSADIPLFMLGELLNDPYRFPRKYEKPHVFSWVMNNYWTTNFRASQEGELNWNYVITSLGGNSNVEASEFGWENRIPVYARVVPAAVHANTEKRESSYLRMDGKGILMTSCVPSKAEKGAILVNVRELEGKDAELSLTGVDGKKLSFTKVNVLDEPTGHSTSKMTLKPYENVFVRVKIK